MAFKMKGSSLYGKVNLNRGGNANRPDGRAKSSAFQKDVQGGVKPTVDVSGGDKTERHSNKYTRVKKETDAMTPGDNEGRLANLAKEYGGTWTREDRSKEGGSKGTFVNEKGETVKDAARNQGVEAAKKKKDYIAKNTTEKPGAPMTDKPKHQKGGSYTYKGKTYAEFSKLPDEAKQQIYAKNAPNQELAKKVYGIKDENRDKEVAKKPGAPKKTDPTEKPDMDKQQNIANPDGGTWKGSGRPKTYKTLQSDGTYKVVTNRSGSKGYDSADELEDTHVTKKQQAQNRADYVEQQNKKVTDKREKKLKRKEGRKKLVSKVKGIFSGKNKRQRDYENLLDQE